MANDEPLHRADVSHRLAERIKELTALRQVIEVLEDRSVSTAERSSGWAAPPSGASTFG